MLGVSLILFPFWLCFVLMLLAMVRAHRKPRHLA
jgi:hypothetical protein